MPDTGAGTWLLPRQVGLANALRLVFSGEPIRAETAKGMGYVHIVVEPEALARTAREEAERLAAVSPLSIRLMKELIYDGLGRSVADHLPAHVEALRTCFASDDHAELATPAGADHHRLRQQREIESTAVGQSQRLEDVRNLQHPIHNGGKQDRAGYSQRDLFTSAQCSNRAHELLFAIVGAVFRCARA